MTESMKTLTFGGLALLIGLTAYATRPSPVGLKPSDKVGQPLFEGFDDPLKAKSLEITSFEAANSQLTSFKVMRNRDGTWSIPSHGDYPADAENQLRDAATALVGLKPLGIASEVAEDHANFGVLAPDKDKTSAGQQGVGLLVKMEDENGKPLAQLVIGKAVKQADNQRFVRVPTQDVVYVVQIDPKKFTTKFGDWIEKDLLKLNAFDVEQIKLRDYSVFRTERGFRMDPRLEATMSFQQGANQWELGELLTYSRGKQVAATLGESEELNKEKIDALKTALDDLQIVDVQRKPKGLTADLRADAGFLNDQEGVDSLFQRGFFPLKPQGSDQIELFSANGEVHVGMKDGVEYLLRFGNFASVEEGSAEGKLNRYLFVMARFNEAKFPEPQYEPEPAIVPTAPPEKPAAKPVDGGASGGNGGADDPPAAGKDAAGKPAEKPADKPAAAPTAKPDAKPADKPAGDAAPPPAEKPAAPPGTAPEAKPGEAKPAAAPDPAAERERIRKENQRKKDEWNEKRKKAQARVQELNARFADWYYVISEDTYRKIHLGRADIIREKTATADEGLGVDAFRKLQKDGLKKMPPAPAPGQGPGPGAFPFQPPN